MRVPEPGHPVASEPTRLRRLERSGARRLSPVQPPWPARLRRTRWAGALVALTLLVTACAEGAEDGSVEEVPEYEGLSPEEIQNRVESITPEQAESLGIVDTTMQIGPPVGPDSIVPLEQPIIGDQRPP